ncbi:MAG: AI-2E family transporter [Bacilli bacterium]|nr:AI-2E family transporter [Bacilli bacterium]
MVNKNDVKKLIILLIIALVAYLFITNFNLIGVIIGKLWNALFPFLLGIIFAFILNIPMTKIEKFLNKVFDKTKISFRGISILISLVIFVLFITFVALELLPALISNLETLINNIPTIFKNVQDYLVNLLEDFPEIQSKINDMFNNSTNFNDLIVKLLNYIVNGSIGFITSFISSLITIFTAIVFAIYMLSQKEYLISGLRKVTKAYLKDKSNKVFEIGKLSNKIFTNFVSGQCVEALILGCIFFVILSIFRFPYALLISVLTTLTALVPIFGALIAMVIGAILIATISPIKALVFIIIFLVIQQIEGNLIYPKVVGKSVGLSPIWTLLAVTVGGSVFGILGMLIGLPLASILYAIIRKDISSRLKESI